MNTSSRTIMRPMSGHPITQEEDLPDRHDPVLAKLLSIYRDLYLHDGYGTFRVEMRFLKKGQKEILLIYGKEFRFVVDAPVDCRP